MSRAEPECEQGRWAAGLTTVLITLRVVANGHSTKRFPGKVTVLTNDGL